MIKVLEEKKMFYGAFPASISSDIRNSVDRSEIKFISLHKLSVNVESKVSCGSNYQLNLVSAGEAMIRRENIVNDRRRKQSSEIIWKFHTYRLW